MYELMEISWMETELGHFSTAESMVKRNACPSLLGWLSKQWV